MLIAVVNRSTLVSNDEANIMCQAIQIQLDLHMLPAWNLKQGTVRFYSDESQVPGYAWVIYLIDDDTAVEGALGFHQEEPTGKVDGYIMVKPILENGGSVLAFDPNNPGNYTVSATLSHEVIETIGDRFTNCWYDCGEYSWCGELCDPVEQIGYPVEVNGVQVSVSDFVFPSYFNVYATEKEHMPFNYLKTPGFSQFAILSGGYCIVRIGGPGTEQQIFGETMPAHRRAAKMKDFARAMRRKELKMNKNKVSICIK
jgi:hypothetical protein